MAYLEPLSPPERPSIPYRRIRRRSNRGLVVALAVTIMMVCAGALWAAHKLGTRNGEPDIPLFHADSDPVKVKPEDPGGMDIPNQNRSYVFDQGSTQAPEHLMPPPDAPLPRPAASDSPSGQASASTLARDQSSSTGLPPVAPPAAAETVPAPSQPTSPTSAAAAPAGRAVTPPAVPPATDSSTASRTTPPASRPEQTAALPPSAGGKGYRLQIASVKTQEGAREEWERIRRQNSDLLASLPFISDRVDLGDRGIFYRIQAGPVADGAEAERICTMLRQRNVGCILVKP